MQDFTTKLTSKNILVPDVWQMTFDCQNPKSLEFEAGQYMVLKVPREDGSYFRKLYSICSPTSSKESFELLTKILPQGIGSDYLKTLNIGDEVLFQGPAGQFIFKQSERPKVFLATGTGIAPVTSILKTHLSDNQRQKLYLYWGIKSYKDLYFFTELLQLSKENPNFIFTICLSREKNLDSLNENEKPFFKKGKINEIFNLQGDCDYYIAGAALIVEDLKQFLLEKGIKIESITTEKFV